MQLSPGPVSPKSLTFVHGRPTPLIGFRRFLSSSWTSSSGWWRCHWLGQVATWPHSPSSGFPSVFPIPPTGSWPSLTGSYLPLLPVCNGLFEPPGSAIPMASTRVGGCLMVPTPIAGYHGTLGLGRPGCPRRGSNPGLTDHRSGPLTTRLAAGTKGTALPGFAA